MSPEKNEANWYKHLVVCNFRFGIMPPAVEFIYLDGTASRGLASGRV